MSDYVSVKSDDQLAKNLFVLHVYGSGADIATPAQRRANLSLYGQSTPRAVVAAWNPAGVIMINRNAQDIVRAQLATGNVGSASQLRRFTEGLRRADSNLLIGIDQEGGRVNRLRSIVGAVPSAGAAGATEEGAKAVAESTASWLRASGFNLNFAPVADVVFPDTPSTGIIGDRSFGTDPSTVGQRVVTSALASQRKGVAAVAKHWPGHGSSIIDSHRATPVLDYALVDVEERNLGPFRAATGSGVAAVMVGHLAVPAWDPTGRPATISKPILQRLRSSFCGVITTDSLWMGGVRAFGKDNVIALDALRAGVDVLLMPVDVSAAVALIRTEAQRDPEFRKRVVEANIRVETLRRRYAVATTRQG